MNRIKDVKSFITAVVTLALGILCVCVFFAQDMERRFLAAGSSCWRGARSASSLPSQKAAS